MDVSEMELSESVESEGRVKIQGRVRNVEPEMNIVLVAERTGAVMVKISDKISVSQFGCGDLVVGFCVPFESEVGKMVKQAGDMVVKSGVVEADRFSPGFLPFTLVNKLGWFSTEVESVPSEDGGVWVEQTVYQSRPWWDEKRLYLTHKIDYIFEWEMVGLEVPDYVEERMDSL
jgi:hypothetical protein